MAYIDRGQVIEAIRKYADIKHSNGEQIEYINGILKSISVINEQPTADVAEVRHGEWMPYSTTMMECSVCKRHTARHRYEFCPHCGAKNVRR